MELTNDIKREYINLINERVVSDASADDMLSYLIDSGAISKRTVIRYVCVAAYPRYLAAHGCKTAAIKQMEADYNVAERTLWYIIQDFPKITRPAQAQRAKSS